MTVVSKKTIYIIEFKYCKDTKPEDQLEKLKTQHSTLIDDLKQSGYTIELVPILIGHSGIHHPHPQQHETTRHQQLPR
jgi:hypothetical protein